MSLDTNLPGHYHATALDRRGKEVATRYLRGTDSHRVVSQWLEAENVRAHKVKVRPVTAREMGMTEITTEQTR